MVWGVKSLLRFSKMQEVYRGEKGAVKVVYPHRHIYENESQAIQ